MSLHRFYSAQVLDHFLNPRQAGSLLPSDTGVSWAQAGSVETGGVLGFQVRVDRTGHITDTRFRAYGCGATIAAGSWVADWLVGKSLEQATSLKAASVVQALDLPPVKMHCALLAEEALSRAIRHVTEH